MDGIWKSILKKLFENVDVIRAVQERIQRRWHSKYGKETLVTQNVRKFLATWITLFSQ